MVRGRGLVVGSCRVVRRARRRQSADDEIGDEIGDLLGRLGALGTEPVSRPVQRAEQRARGDGRIRGSQLAAPHSFSDERAHPALVSIPFRDDALAEPRRQRIDFEMRRRSFDLVEQTEDMADRERSQPRGERLFVAPGRRERGEEPIERPILAEEEQFVLAAEVVIEVAGRQVCGGRDVAHAGGGEAVRPEQARGGAEDADAPGVGPK
jgi:hypothetical protein